MGGHRGGYTGGLMQAVVTGILAGENAARAEWGSGNQSFTAFISASNAARISFKRGIPAFDQRVGDDRVSIATDFI